MAIKTLAITDVLLMLLAKAMIKLSIYDENDDSI